MKVVNFESRDFKRWLTPLRRFCDFHNMYPTADKFTSQESVGRLYTCFYRRMEDSEAYDSFLGIKQVLRQRRPKERLSYQKWINEVERFIYSHGLLNSDDVIHALNFSFLQEAYEQQYSTLEGVDVVLGWIKVTPLEE